MSTGLKNNRDHCRRERFGAHNCKKNRIHLEYFGMKASIFLAVAAAQVCENTCFYAGDGECDDGSPGSDFDVCACGTDCDDCGPQFCTNDDYQHDDCPDGYRTCSTDSLTWCCDRSSRFDQCGDEGFCKSNTSKKSKKTAVAVVVTIVVVVIVGVIGGILACCFLCAGCPGAQCLEQNRRTPPVRIVHEPAPTAYNTKPAQVELTQA